MSGVEVSSAEAYGSAGTLRPTQVQFDSVSQGIDDNQSRTRKVELRALDLSRLGAAFLINVIARSESERLPIRHYTQLNHPPDPTSVEHRV